jgi:hypothetical protein
VSGRGGRESSRGSFRSIADHSGASRGSHKTYLYILPKTTSSFSSSSTSPGIKLDALFSESKPSFVTSVAVVASQCIVAISPGEELELVAILLLVINEVEVEISFRSSAGCSCDVKQQAQCAKTSELGSDCDSALPRI